MLKILHAHRFYLDPRGCEGIRERLVRGGVVGDRREFRFAFAHVGVRQARLFITGSPRIHHVVFIKPPAQRVAEGERFSRPGVVHLLLGQPGLSSRLGCKRSESPWFNCMVILLERLASFNFEGSDELLHRHRCHARLAGTGPAVAAWRSRAVSRAVMASRFSFLSETSTRRFWPFSGKAAVLNQPRRRCRSVRLTIDWTFSSGMLFGGQLPDTRVRS